MKDCTNKKNLRRFFGGSMKKKLLISKGLTESLKNHATTSFFFMLEKMGQTDVEEKKSQETVELEEVERKSFFPLKGKEGGGEDYGIEKS